MQSNRSITIFCTQITLISDREVRITTRVSRAHGDIHRRKWSQGKDLSSGNWVSITIDLRTVHGCRNCPRKPTARFNFRVPASALNSPSVVLGVTNSQSHAQLIGQLQVTLGIKGFVYRLNNIAVLVHRTHIVVVIIHHPIRVTAARKISISSTGTRNIKLMSSIGLLTFWHNPSHNGLSIAQPIWVLRSSVDSRINQSSLSRPLSNGVVLIESLVKVIETRGRSPALPSIPEYS